MNILFVIHTLDYADHISISYLSAIAKELGHLTYLCILDKDDLVDGKPRKIFVMADENITWNEGKADEVEI